MTIAFLGLGAMGLPMARNLLRAGHDVAAWNRNAERTALLVADGARPCASPGEAVAGAAEPDAADTRLRDALLALVALGYKQEQARKMAVEAIQAASGESLSVEEIVKRALGSV